MLPSIHRSSFDEDAVSRLEDTQLPNCNDRFLASIVRMLDVSSHHTRLQDEKRFLNNIQPLMTVRRYCLIQLNKKNSKESLGIRLAQQKLRDLRYIIVQLESDGIAHRCV
jgi:hypothetical protein